MKTVHQKTGFDKGDFVIVTNVHRHLVEPQVVECVRTTKTQSVFEYNGLEFRAKRDEFSFNYPALITTSKTNKAGVTTIRKHSPETYTELVAEYHEHVGAVRAKEEAEAQAARFKQADFDTDHNIHPAQFDEFELAFIRDLHRIKDKSDKEIERYCESAKSGGFGFRFDDFPEYIAITAKASRIIDSFLFLQGKNWSGSKYDGNSFDEFRNNLTTHLKDQAAEYSGRVKTEDRAQGYAANYILTQLNGSRANSYKHWL